jgi:ankyrin repeat protein
VDIARILLERRADANARDKDGWTPLHRASFRGDADLVRVLVEGGADVTIQDERGWTPLHRASYEGKTEASRVLLERGAFATAQDKFGYTPLYLAQDAGHPELVRILLECAVDVRAVVQAFLNSKAASGAGQETLGTSGEPVEVANVSENGIAGL